MVIWLSVSRSLPSSDSEVCNNLAALSNLAKGWGITAEPIGIMKKPLTTQEGSHFLQDFGLEFDTIVQLIEVELLA